MKLTLLFSALLFSILSYTQPTNFSYKDIVFNPIVHATLQIHYKGQYILVDPSVDSLELSPLAKPDIILYTDIHGDHLNIENLKALELKPNTVIIAPKAVEEKITSALPDKHFNIVLLNNGENKKLKDFDIDAIPMYNLTSDRLKFHTKGRGNGYVIHFGKTKVYISGDTEDIPEMRALKNIDVAFVCMNLPYTMDIEHAESAVLAFKPKVVIPYHYRGQNGLSDVNAFQKAIQEKDPKIKVELLKWY